MDLPLVDPDRVVVLPLATVTAPPRFTVKVWDVAADELTLKLPLILVTPKNVSVTDPVIVGVILKFP